MSLFHTYKLVNKLVLWFEDGCACMNKKGGRENYVLDDCDIDENVNLIVYNILFLTMS